ncbi:hypothetical protein V8E54_009968 [Elaphomyces granulatus]
MLVMGRVCGVTTKDTCTFYGGTDGALQLASPQTPLTAKRPIKDHTDVDDIGEGPSTPSSSKVRCLVLDHESPSPLGSGHLALRYQLMTLPQPNSTSQKVLNLRICVTPESTASTSLHIYYPPPSASATLTHYIPPLPHPSSTLATRNWKSCERRRNRRVRDSSVLWRPDNQIMVFLILTFYLILCRFRRYRRIFADTISAKICVTNIVITTVNQSASSKQALEDELVLALDTIKIKHLKEQLRGRQSRRSNNITPVEEIMEDEIRSGRDNGQGRGRPRTPTDSPSSTHPPLHTATPRERADATRFSTRTG